MRGMYGTVVYTRNGRKVRLRDQNRKQLTRALYDELFPERSGKPRKG